MSNIVRLIGGPADQELRAIPEDKDKWIVEEINEFNTDDVNYPIAISAVIKTKRHLYLRAFPGASYFKYQGIMGEPIEA